jgi:uncharacterized protein YcfJ
MNMLPTQNSHESASIDAHKNRIHEASLVSRAWSEHRASGAVAVIALLTILAFLPARGVIADQNVQEVPVISSYPVYQTVVREEPREQCHIEQVARHQSRGKSATPAIVGTILGGALGNALGSKKSNQRVGAVVGGVLGYSIGKDVGRLHTEHHGSVRYEEREVCSTVYERIEEERLTGYDVSYAYGGQTYKTRMRRDPGSTVRVRVQVEPI